MRIALLSLHTSPAAIPGNGDAGGMNVVVSAAAQALARRGHAVHVFTRAAADAPPGERPLDPGLPHGARLITVSAGPVDLRKEELPAIVPDFTRVVSAAGAFDVVHGHYWLSGIAALEIAAATGRPPAVTLHTVAAQKNRHRGPAERPEPEIRLAAERRITQRALMIAGSRSELEGIVASYGAPPHGSAVIAPGVDTRRFRPGIPATERSVARIPAHDPFHGTANTPLHRITVLGRVQPLKGQDLAIRAAGVIARRDPHLWANCELVIAGEPTPGAETYASSLRVLAGELGIASRTRWLPALPREETAELLAASTLVVVPSTSETFGLVALEAAACGVPSIVGAHTGFLDSAPDGVSAMHVAGREPEDWADAIRRLLTDPERAAALGERGREFALAHDWDAHAARLEAVYERLRG